MAPTKLDPKQVYCPQCKAHAGSPCKRPSEHTVPFGETHKDRKERAEFISKLDTNHNQHTLGHRRLAHLILAVECPFCKAPKGMPCDCFPADYDYHSQRESAYHEMKGTDLTKRHDRPYCWWPDADEFKRWGIFMHRSGSASGPQYGNNPVKLPFSKHPATFSSYEQAQHYEAKLEKNHKWRQKNRGCLGVFPMYLASNGKWAHYEY